MNKWEKIEADRRIIERKSVWEINIYLQVMGWKNKE